MTTKLDCPYHRDGLCIDVVRVTEQASNLIEWQKTQNGHLSRIDDELTSIRLSISRSAGRLQWWLISLLGSALLAVALLAANLAQRHI